MFLEKHSRFFRRFEFSFAPRHTGAPHLPIFSEANQFSIFDALSSRVDEEKALEVQPNGDIVELMEVAYDAKSKALKMLFHRASPSAAEPTYRKKARQKAGKKVTIRKAEKHEGEEQSVSAHLIVLDDPIRQGTYRAALEEIPGISMAVVRRVIGQALHAYEYDFERKKKQINTYSTFKPVGVPSETLTGALKGGTLSYITLVRPAKADFVDADGLFRPQTETMRIRVEGQVINGNWRDHLPAMIRRAKSAGWTDFSVDLELDDQRRRTVKLDKQDEAKEVLFVRSDELNFQTELDACSVDIVDEVVTKVLSLIRQG
ncbi:hypothetical protein [Microvirga massiliensis]|uniref:hypothetical protein n=1 Tax=Microvirga massiliensis TaxID=1033741 RepID=UPI00062BA059|nr:hypothetical protein [Microvirga massiliensis]